MANQWPRPGSRESGRIDSIHDIDSKTCTPRTTGRSATAMAAPQLNRRSNHQMKLAVTMPHARAALNMGTYAVLTIAA